jgi:hypothetical protein
MPVPGGPVWDQTCSSTPSASTPSSRPAAAIRRAASTRTASQMVCQETPSWWARAETEVSNRCSASVAHPTALVVSFARDPAIGCSSVNVVLGQSGSGHRQTRLAHRSRTGRPKHGMSWSRIGRRPWPTATTPQSGQPVTSSPVSTPRTRPAPVAVTELMWMPSTPSSASARVHHRPWEQDIELFMSGSLLGIGLLGRNQFKEALTSFPPHHATPKRPTPWRQPQTALTTLKCEGPLMLGARLRSTITHDVWPGTRFHHSGGFG